MITRGPRDQQLKGQTVPVLGGTAGIRLEKAPHRARPDHRGCRDRVVPLANAQFLDERLPTSHLVVIDAGHFVWEEAPAEYAAALGAS